jgi:aminoglycoside/choline kinase family phosphotransferase
VTIRTVEREAAKDAFLRAAGFGAAQRAPLAGDASARRYERVTGGPAPAVLMDAPPEAGEDVRPFAALTGWLRAQGFGAPEVFAADPEAGFLLLEDLGDGLYARLCAADPGAEATLYEAAVDLLLALRDVPPPTVAEGAGCAHRIPPYDTATLIREARLAVDWWAPAAHAPLSPDASAEYDARVAEACAMVSESRATLVLRDYHAENLVWAPQAAGLGRVRLLDYQDALAGHPAYDLISLLEDARRDTAPELRAAMTARYVGGAGADPSEFSAACAALAAQRNLKIVGIFGRLALRDRKPAYLSLIPRVWAHLMRDLSDPRLAPLAAFTARWIPEPTPERLAAAGARAA